MEELTATTIVGKRNQDVLDQLHSIERVTDEHSPRSTILEIFEPLCRAVISDIVEFFAKAEQQETDIHPQDVPYTNEVVGLLSTLCVRLGQKELFLEILSFDFQKMPKPSRTGPCLFPSIGMGIAEFGPGALEPNLTLNLTRVLSFNLRCTMIDLITEGFRASSLSSGDLETSNAGDSGGNYSSTPASSRASPFEVDARNTQSFQRWVESHYSWALTHCSLREDDDFAQLMRVGIILDKDTIWQEIIAVAESQICTPGHLLSFIDAFFQAAEDQQFPREMGLDTFRAIFYNLHEQLKQPLISHPSYRRIDSLKIASILCHCLRLELYPEFDQTITGLLHEISTTPIDNMDETILPLLSTFLKCLIIYNFPLNLPRVRLLFQETLTLARRRYIGRQPHKPSSWARPCSTCHCTHCIEINSFLTDPFVSRIRIRKPFSARIHLEAQLTLDGGEGEFQCEHKRNGGVHTLVVEKNNVSMRFEQESEAWKRRREAISAKFLELGMESLRELFGDQFREVFNLNEDGGDGDGGAGADKEQVGMLSGWGEGDDDEASDEEPEIVYLGFF